MNKLQLIISEVLNENSGGNIAGSGGVFGSPSAATQFSADTYAKGDARLPKIIGSVIRRTFPELLALSKGIKRRKKKLKHKRKHKTKSKK